MEKFFSNFYYNYIYINLVKKNNNWLFFQVLKYKFANIEKNICIHCLLYIFNCNLTNIFIFNEYFFQIKSGFDILIKILAKC